MDIISHALYGGVAFGRSSRSSYAKAFFFGLMPDLFSFGLFFILVFMGVIPFTVTHIGPPETGYIPVYIRTIYDLLHSLVVVVGVCSVVYFTTKSIPKELFAWPLHILVDIPTHSADYFPTHFLWPVSDVYVNGISWATSSIFIPNIVLLLILYTWFLITNIQKRRSNVP